MMSPLERCVYLELLFSVYECGGRIPSDRQHLARIAMVTREELDSAWPMVGKHFVPCEDDPSALTNLVAISVLADQEPYHAAKVQAGRLGGIASGRSRKRTAEAAEANDEPIEERRREENQIRGNEKRKESRAHSGSSLRADPRQVEFLESYPKKTAVERARTAYAATITTPELHVELMEGLRRWQESAQWKESLADDGGRFVPDPDRFITDRRWQEHPPVKRDSMDEVFRVMEELSGEQLT
jgi:uncharacterized protein YdaU (DUF1376 family)